MNGWTEIGRWLMVVGLVLVGMGGVIWLLGRYGGWNRLPGTLRFDFPGGTCMIPILGSILLSVVLTVVLNLVVRLLNR